MKRAVFAIILMMLAEGALADDWDVHRPYGANRPIGLSASINVGMLIANKKQAEFYSGRYIYTDIDPDICYLDWIMGSDLFRQRIVDDLTRNDVIAPSTLGTTIKIDEYPSLMHYKLTYQIGLGIRYDLESTWGFLLRFDWSRLTAAGGFNLSTNAALLGDRQYITCTIGGQEDRINIDLGVLKRFYFSENIALELDLGFNLNNLKVKSFSMNIEGQTYDILNRWGNNRPGVNSAEYDYINQGGIGYGGFAGLAVCYVIGHSGMGSIDLGYNFYYERLKLEGYSGFAPQHSIFLRFNLQPADWFNKE